VSGCYCSRVGNSTRFPKGGARSDGEGTHPLSSRFCACYSSRTERNPCAMYRLRCFSMMMMNRWCRLGWPQWHAAVDPPCAAAGLKNHTARTEISLSLCFHHDLLFRPHCGDELRAPLTRPVKKWVWVALSLRTCSSFARTKKNSSLSIYPKFETPGRRLRQSLS
jgi:hypothetical protein